VKTRRLDAVARLRWPARATKRPSRWTRGNWYRRYLLREKVSARRREREWRVFLHWDSPCDAHLHRPGASERADFGDPCL